jgi:hypothetical protein
VLLASRAHVFCSFLVLLLKTELERRIKFADLERQWAQVLRGLNCFGSGETSDASWLLSSPQSIKKDR